MSRALRLKSRHIRHTSCMCILTFVFFVEIDCTNSEKSEQVASGDLTGFQDCSYIYEK